MRICIISIGGAYGGIGRLVEDWVAHMDTGDIHFDYVCPAFPGIDDHAAHLARYDVKVRASKRLQTLLVHPEPQPGKKDSSLPGHKPVERAHSIKKRLMPFVPKALLEARYRAVSLKQGATLFADLLPEKAPDLIHINSGSYRWALGAVVAARQRFPGARILFHLHNPPVFGSLTTSEMRLVNGADVRVFASHGALAAWRQEHVIAEPAVVLQNCVDLEAFPFVDRSGRTENQPYIFGVCSRLTTVKRLDVAIQALARVRATGLAVELMIVGRGSEEENLRSLAIREGVAKAVHFEGETRNVFEKLEAIDAFLMVSRSEGGVPMGLLEAMATGLPAIGSRIGGVMEAMQEGETGLVVTSGAVDELAEAMVHLASHRAEGLASGRLARLRVEKHFSHHRMIAELKKLYGVG